MVFFFGFIEGNVEINCGLTFYHHDGQNVSEMHGRRS